MAKRWDEYMREQGIPVPGEGDTTYAPPEFGKAAAGDVAEGAHPQMGSERYIVMNLATNPKTAKRYLESEGWEVEHEGGWDFRVRKPGEKTWYYLDPKGFDLGDILDIGGDIATGVAQGAGAAVGLPAGLPGAAAGGAAAGAGAESVKALVGELFGVSPTAGELATGVAGEAALGAAAPFLGEAVGAIGRKILPGGTARKLVGMSDEALEELARKEGHIFRRGREAMGGRPVPVKPTPPARPLTEAVQTARAPSRKLSEEELIQSIWGKTAPPKSAIPSKLFGEGSEVMETFGLAGPAGGKGGRIAPLTGKRLRPERAQALSGAAEAYTKAFGPAGEKVSEEIMLGAGRGVRPQTELLRALKAPAKRQAQFEKLVGETPKAGQTLAEAVKAARKKPAKALTESAREDIIAEILGKQPLSKGAMLAKKLSDSGMKKGEKAGIIESLAHGAATLAIGSSYGAAAGAGYGALNPRGLRAALSAAKKGIGWAGRALLRNQEPMRRIARAKETPRGLRLAVQKALDLFDKGDTQKFKAALYTLLSRPAFRKAMEPTKERT